MDRREFQLIDDASKKFWAIKLDGKSFVVHYGRIGTIGQTQEKTFATEDAAKAEYNKLIAEKAKKGYAEVAAGSTGASGAPPIPTVKPPTPKTSSKDATTTVSEPVTAEVKAPPVESKPIPNNIERTVRLKDDDWNRVTWKRSKPVKKLQERPLQFDKLWEDLKVSASSWGQIYLHNIDIPEGASKEEAWFWLNLLTSSKGGLKVEEAEKRVNEIRAIKVGGPEEVCALLTKAEHRGFTVYRRAPHLLLPYFGPLQIASMLIETVVALASAHNVRYQRVFLAFESIRAFSQYILPYMSEEERANFRNTLEKAYDDERDVSSGPAIFIISLLSIIGGGSRLAVHVASQPNGSWSNRWNSEGNLDVLAGLANEAAFVAEARRLLGKLTSPAEVRLWLAATEWRELDMVADAVKAAGSKDDATALARLLALVEAPEAVVPMLEVQLESKAPVIAVDWLSQHPLLVVVGLVPAAMGQGKIAEAAREHLHTMRRDRLTPVLKAAISHLTPAQGACAQAF